MKHRFFELIILKNEIVQGRVIKKLKIGAGRDHLISWFDLFGESKILIWGQNLKKLGAVVKKSFIKQWKIVYILQNAMIENGPFPLPLNMLLTKLIVRDVTSNKETIMFDQQSLLIALHLRWNCIWSALLVAIMSSRIRNTW